MTSYPNMLKQPNIRPPYPLWEPTRDYFVGDLVFYAGTNWLLLFPFFGESIQQVVGPPPDWYPITFNNVPGKSPGIYNPPGGGPPPLFPPDNPAGGCWVNLGLVTPPAPTWSPSVNYAVGDVVMYPPESPGSYWRCVVPSFNNTPQLPFFSPGSIGLQIAPQNWELLNATSAPQPPQYPDIYAESVIPVPAVDTFGGVVVAQTIVCTWTVSFPYTGYTLTLTPTVGSPTVVQITNGTTLTYTFSGLAANTYSVSIVPKYGSQVGPGSSQSGLVVITETLAWGSFGVEFSDLKVAPLPSVPFQLDTFVTSVSPQPTVTVSLYSVDFPTPTEVLIGAPSTIGGTSSNQYISTNPFNPEVISYPKSMIAKTSTAQTPPVYLAYDSASFTSVPITINGGLGLSTPGNPNVITWNGATAIPPLLTGATPASQDFVFQLFRTINGGSLASLGINGMNTGTLTDTTVYTATDVIVYTFVPRMTYTVNGVIVQQSGPVSTFTGTIPP